MEIEIKKLEKSEVEITGEIAADVYDGFWGKAIAHLSDKAEMDGFRPGHIPENVLLKNLGEGAVLEEAAEMALQEYYPKMILEHKIDAIGRPKIAITKMAKGNPLGFKIVTAVMPAVKLPDYKAIAARINGEYAKKPIEVTDEDVDNLIMEIRRRRAAIDAQSAAAVGEAIAEKKDAELPELTDDFVKTLGKFENVADFKVKIRENLKSEKELAEKEAARVEMVEEIDAKTEVELPEIMIKYELDRGVAELKGEIDKAGIEFEKYLEEIKKTEEDIRKDYRGRAEKRARFNMIVKGIARAEMIGVDEKTIAAEADRLMKVYPEADLEAARVYIEDMMVNSKVFEFLEAAK